MKFIQTIVNEGRAINREIKLTGSSSIVISNETMLETNVYASIYIYIHVKNYHYLLVRLFQNLH